MRSTESERDGLNGKRMASKTGAWPGTGRKNETAVAAFSGRMAVIPGKVERLG